MSGSTSTPLPAAVVVRTAFADYAKGQIITDEKTIETLFAENHAKSLVAVHPDATKKTVLDAEHSASHAEPAGEEH